MKKIKYLGGLSKDGFKLSKSREVKQGKRIYSSDALAVTLLSVSLGSVSGMSSLYVVKI